jgi:hypothetical protein
MGRKTWEAKAEKLRAEGLPWRVGRTDMKSYDAMSGEYVHFAYGPDDVRIPFEGTPFSALRDAVKYAKSKNQEAETNGRKGNQA